MIKCSKINTFKTKYYFEKCKKIPRSGVTNNNKIKKHNTKSSMLLKLSFLLNI